MSTAEAPIGATSSTAGHPSPNTIADTSAVNAMLTAAPIHATSRPPNVAPARIGTNRTRKHITFIKKFRTDPAGLELSVMSASGIAV